MSHSLTIDQAFTLAVQHHQSGRLADAESIYRQILSIAPDHPDAMHLLGVLAIQTNNPQQAVDLISKALAIHPNITRAVAPYYSNLAQAYQKLQNFDAAITHCRRALDLDPAFGDAAFNLVTALIAANRLDEALTAANRRLQLAPNDAPMHRLKANLLARQRRFEDALASYRDSLRFDPNNAEALFNQGVALANLGRPDQAIPSFQQSLAFNPNDTDTLMALAETLSRTGRSTDALNVYSQILQHNPNNAEAHAGSDSACVSLPRNTGPSMPCATR